MRVESGGEMIPSQGLGQVDELEAADAQATTSTDTEAPADDALPADNPTWSKTAMLADRGAGAVSLRSTVQQSLKTATANQTGGAEAADSADAPPSDASAVGAGQSADGGTVSTGDLKAAAAAINPRAMATMQAALQSMNPGELAQMTTELETLESDLQELLGEEGTEGAEESSESSETEGSAGAGGAGQAGGGAIGGGLGAQHGKPIDSTQAYEGVSGAVSSLDASQVSGGPEAVSASQSAGPAQATEATEATQAAEAIGAAGQVDAELEAVLASIDGLAGRIADAGLSVDERIGAASELLDSAGVMLDQLSLDLVGAAE